MIDDSSFLKVIVTVFFTSFILPKQLTIGLGGIELLLDSLENATPTSERAKRIEEEIDQLLNLKKIDTSNIVPKQSG